MFVLQLIISMVLVITIILPSLGWLYHGGCVGYRDAVLDGFILVVIIAVILGGVILFSWAVGGVYTGVFG